MNGVVRARRMVGLLVLATLLVLGAVLIAPNAEAKKKKKINVVHCVVNSEGTCFGTAGRDRLVGTDSDEDIRGQEGNDVYQGNGGDDIFFDSSPTSNDVYTGYDPSFIGFGSDEIIDNGGDADFLDLSSLRMLDDVTLVRVADRLFLDGPGINNVSIDNHFGAGRIEKIKFANGTITGTQAESLAREATPEEQTAIEKRFDEEQLGERLPEEAPQRSKRP